MIAHGPVGYTIGVLRDADLQRRFAAASSFNGIPSAQFRRQSTG
jgi:hypothetical protein